MTEPVGQKWQPACSVDGVYQEEICCRCQHDEKYQDGTGDSCEIAADMYANGSDPHWLIGLDGKPFCTRFKSIEQSYRCPLTKDMFKE